MRVATIAGVFSFCVSWYSLTALAQTQAADVEACRNGKASPDEMIAICSRAIGSGRLPALDLAELHTYRGWNWISKRDIDKAIADFSTAISLEPQISAGYAGRGQAYLLKRDYRLAVEDASRAIRIRPQSDIPWFVRGAAWIHLGKFNDAANDLGEAIGRDPSNSYAYYLRATAWRRLGNYERATSDLKEAVRLQPQFADAWAALAWVLATAPQPAYRNGTLAVEYAHKAWDMSDRSDNTLHYRRLQTLAAAYAEAGQFDKADMWMTIAMSYAAPTPEDRARAELYRGRKPFRENPASAVSP